MKQDFKQAWISKHGVQFFEKNFKKLWNLDYYHDPTQPAIFFGLYHPEDIDKLISHKGPKIIVWGGNDMQSYQLNLISFLQQTQEIYTWAYPGWFSNILSQYKIKHKSLYIAIKDYSEFTPITLGENLYVYKGIHGNRPDHYKWDEVIKPLIEVFGEDRITFTNHLPIDRLIHEIYKNCFVYVKPNPKGGCTTMFELGHMGVRTLGIGNFGIDIFSEYNSIENLIELVIEESKFIGKTREDMALNTKKIFTGKEWLNLNFWNE